MFSSTLVTSLRSRAWLRADSNDLSAAKQFLLKQTLSASLTALMQKNFDEWGPIERIYNVPSKTIAFVQYYWRAAAEFAKEAMQVRCSGQVLWDM